MARTFGGGLAGENRGVVDHSWQGLAYACQSQVVILDPKSLLPVQTVNVHHKFVTAVKWAPSPELEAGLAENTLLLASGDSSGRVFVSDVVKGQCVVSLRYEKEPGMVLPTTSVSWRGSSIRYLFSTHAGTAHVTLCLWDTQTQALLWAEEYESTNPVNSKFASDPFDVTRGVVVTPSALLLIGDIGETDKPNVLATYQPNKADILRATYFNAERSLVVVTGRRALAFFDTHAKQVVSVLKLDDSEAPFVDVFVPRYNGNMLFCLHGNGTISARRRPQSGVLQYETLCYSDTVRFSKPSEVMGVALDPKAEDSLFVVTIHGHLYRWLLVAKAGGERHALTCPNLIDKGTARAVCLATPQESTTTAATEDSADAKWPRMAVAVGLENGSVQIVDMRNGMLLREVCVQDTAVLRVVWAYPSTVFTISTEPGPANTLKSRIHGMNLETGRARVLRAEKAGETNAILDMQLSPSQSYMLLAMKGGARGLELYDTAPNAWHGRPVPSISEVAAITWCKASSSAASTSEHFLVALGNGSLRCFTVEGKDVKPGFRLDSMGTNHPILSLDWYQNYVVSSDTHAQLSVWKFKDSMARSYPTQRGAALKLQMGMSAGRLLMLVRFSDALEMWDVAQQQRVSAIVGRKPGIVSARLCVIDIAWLDGMPLVLCDDGSLRLLDAQMRTAAVSPMHSYRLPPSFFCTALYNFKTTETLRALLCDRTCDGASGLELPNDVSEPLRRLLDPSLATASTADRCLRVAEALNDQSTYNFWLLAKHYIGRGYVTAEPRASVFYLDGSQGELPTEPRIPTPCPRTDSVPLCFDALAETDDLLSASTRRIALRAGLAPNAVPLEVVAQNVFFGDTALALQQLTDKAFGDTTSSLLAIAVAAVSAPERLESVATHAAINLMSHGEVMLGVVLLSLLNKRPLACHYLQSFGYWSEAARMAKSILPRSECATVINRQVEHLLSPRQARYTEATLLLLSLGQFDRVLEVLLREVRRPTLAAMFLRALQEGGQMPTDLPSDSPMVLLQREVWSEYAKHLDSLGLAPVAANYTTAAAGGITTS